MPSWLMFDRWFVGAFTGPGAAARRLRTIGFCLLASWALVTPLHAQTADADQPKGLREITALAKVGDAEAQYQLGLVYRDGLAVNQDAGQAYRWFRQAADKGHAAAAYEVGQLEEDGEGIEKNLPDAADWYRKAAAQGHLPAVFALAELYRQGLGVTKDAVAAARLLRSAADKNDVDSELALGKMCQDGDGIPKNLNEAGVWFRKAAQAGSAEGRHLLALFLLGGDPAVAPVFRPPSRADVEALDWLGRAAEQGYAPAQLSLAMAYFRGIVAPLDLGAARPLLRLAVDQGYPPAVRRLGQFYRDGQGFAKDPGRAYMYLELAAELGEKGAEGERDALAREVAPPLQQAAKRRAAEWRQARGL